MAYFETGAVTATLAAAAAVTGSLPVQQGQDVLFASQGATWTGNVQAQLSVDAGTTWYLFGDVLTKGTREAAMVVMRCNGLVRLIANTGFTGSVSATAQKYERVPD